MRSGLGKPSTLIIFTFFTIHIVLNTRTGSSPTELCFSFACISTTSKVLALVSDSKLNLLHIYPFYYSTELCNHLIKSSRKVLYIFRQTASAIAFIKLAPYTTQSLQEVSQGRIKNKQNLSIMCCVFFWLLGRI